MSSFASPLLDLRSTTPTDHALMRPGVRALALGVGVWLLVALVLAGLFWQSYRLDEDQAMSHLAELAHRQQIRNDVILHATQGLTVSLAGSLAPILQERRLARQILGTGLPPSAEAAFVRRAWERSTELLAGRPSLAGLSVITTEGEVLAGTQGMLMPPRDAGDRMALLEEAPAQGVDLLPPVHDPLLGGWQLPLVRRILAGDGSLLGFIEARIWLPALTSAIAESDLRRIVTATMLRDDGVILATYPADAEVLGRTARDFADTHWRVGGGAGRDLPDRPVLPADGSLAYDLSSAFRTLILVGAPPGWVTATWLGRMWPYLALSAAVLLTALLAIAAAARQIGRRAQAMARMRFQNMLLAAQQDSSLQGVAIVDDEGNLRYFNRQIENVWRLHGLLTAGQRIETMLDRIAAMLAEPCEIRRLAEECETLTAGTRREVLHLRDARRVECTVKALVDARGAVTGRIWSFLDVSAELRAEEAIRWRSDYDPLTHLPNRSLFKRRLSEMMIAAREEGESGALLYIDLDGFKWINDTRGHAIGDQLLIQVSDRLSACVRSRDGVARLGGDEFVVMLPRVSSEIDARNMARRILTAVAEPYSVDHHLCHLSASIGIVLFPSERDDVTALLKKADMSMYAAKADGKNRYCFFTPEMDAAAAERQRIEVDMRAALGTGQFVFHYQPIVDLARGELAGFEALLRWHHPTDGVLAPGRFVEVAEETGLINRISADAILQAARDLGPLLGARPELHLAVNLSVRQFQDESLVELLASLRAQGEVPLDRFLFEITESLMMSGDTNTRRMFDLVRGSGAKIAVDDFGTGYSSLVYLQNFPVDYLKVDRSFVANMLENEESRQLVSSILSMAKSLRMEAIAEGVENEAQMRHLQQQQCEFAQGYYFCRPLALQDALAFAEDREAMAVTTASLAAQ
ncbi:EAL domain-containing protein [Marinibaculum pumilum]|uniref:EAL domain-containing protein n=1 Tax=Marinibaculum pumilum TaxID=1766165 RepID=A0ABV7L273_9PROT